MSRPLRIEFPDALYHVTARGGRREDIFEDDQDRHTFLATLEQVIGQFNWTCYARNQWGQEINGVRSSKVAFSLL